METNKYLNITKNINFNFFFHQKEIETKKRRINFEDINEKMTSSAGKTAVSRFTMKIGIFFELFYFHLFCHFLLPK